jgi:hypothetical protein
MWAPQVDLSKCHDISSVCVLACTHREIHEASAMGLQTLRARRRRGVVVTWAAWHVLGSVGARIRADFTLTSILHSISIACVRLMERSAHPSMACPARCRRMHRCQVVHLDALSFAVLACGPLTLTCTYLSGAQAPRAYIPGYLVTADTPAWPDFIAEVVRAARRGA